MQINIAYLYYDLLNLYGENGNIKALKKELEHQGVKVNIHFVTIDEELDLNNYDLIYIGAGTETNQKIVIPHLMKYKKDIEKSINNNKFFLVTGNSISLFGKYIETNEQKIDTLGIFNYYTKEEDFRMSDECIMKCSFLDKPIIGYQNQSSVMKDNPKPMFEVIKGIGSYPKSQTEGIHDHNFYGTYVIGPILIRNPELLEHLIRELLTSKDKDFKFKEFDLKQNKEAYESFVKTFYDDII